MHARDLLESRIRHLEEGMKGMREREASLKAQHREAVRHLRDGDRLLAEYKYERDHLILAPGGPHHDPIKELTR